jgi:AraC-like DNA-binding protein
MAKNLLRSSAVSAAEISDLLGYRNLSSFSRAFERECGMRPLKYRRTSQAT